MNNTQKTKAIIFDFNRTIYDPESSKLMENATKVLQYCFKKYDCFLVSFNENNRESLFDDLGIRKHFKRIALVDKKEQRHFIDILENSHYEKIFVVGDRIKGEIKIGNELGYETIWLRNGKYFNEMPQSKLETPNHIINSLSELEKLI